MRRSQLTATLPLFFSFALLTNQTLAADFTGRVVGVADGDTITVLHNGKGERIRLHGIDSPENLCVCGVICGVRSCNHTFAMRGGSLKGACLFFLS